MRVLIYLRVSSAGQVDGYGLDNQLADCRAFCRRNGHKIVGVFTEKYTGTADERPELTAMLQDLRHSVPGRRTRPADGVVLGKLDRLARALTVQEGILAMLWKLELKVFAADQGEILPDDPDDPMRTAMRQMMGVFAELDRRTILKRMRDGIKAKRAQGRHATGTYPYGYHGVRSGRQIDAQPHPDEMLAVARILELRAADASYREIAAALDAEGLPPRKAAKWSSMAVRNIALREAARIAR